MANKSLSDTSPIQICRLVRHRPRRYDRAVLDALTTLWAASNRACGKRLKALSPVLIPALERHGHLRLEPAVRSKLLAASAATIDRLLREVRIGKARGGPERAWSLAAGGRQTTRAQDHWADGLPGRMLVQLRPQGDTAGASGELSSLSLTDLYSGWTECAALASHDASEIIRRLDALARSLPFELRGLAAGAGCAAVADELGRYCAEHRLEAGPGLMTRTAATPCVAAGESGSGAWRDVPRVPDDRAARAGSSPAEARSRLLAAIRLYANHFDCADAHAAERRDAGGRAARCYSAAQSPCIRLLASPALSEDAKSRLRARLETLDPLALLARIDALRAHSAVVAPESNVEAAAGAENAAGRGARSKSGPRYWRTHRDAFETARPAIESWLASDPRQTSQAVFERLRREFPGAYREGQLRSLQRRLREWRGQRRDEAV